MMLSTTLPTHAIAEHTIRTEAALAQVHQAAGAEHRIDTLHAEATSAITLGTRNFVYNIQVTTFIHLNDQYGNSLGTRSFTTRGQAVVGRPAAAAGRREVNLFNLQIESGADDGGISFASASAIRVRGQKPYPTNTQLLLGYWSYATKTNGSFAGSLKNDNTRLGAQLNFLIAPSTVAAGISVSLPIGMGVGTRITGKFSGNQLAVLIVGNTIDTLHPFAIYIQGSTSKGPVI